MKNALCFLSDVCISPNESVRGSFPEMSHWWRQERKLVQTSEEKTGPLKKERNTLTPPSLSLSLSLTYTHSYAYTYQNHMLTQTYYHIPPICGHSNCFGFFTTRNIFCCTTLYIHLYTSWWINKCFLVSRFLCWSRGAVGGTKWQEFLFPACTRVSQRLRALPGDYGEASALGGSHAGAKEQWRLALSNCSSESRGSRFTEPERHYMVLDVCSHDISLGMTDKLGRNLN